MPCSWVRSGCGELQAPLLVFGSQRVDVLHEQIDPARKRRRLESGRCKCELDSDATACHGTMIGWFADDEITGEAQLLAVVRDRSFDIGHRQHRSDTDETARLWS